MWYKKLNISKTKQKVLIFRKDQYIKILTSLIFLNLFCIGSIYHPELHVDGQDFSCAHYVPEDESKHCIVCTYPFGVFEELYKPALKQFQKAGFHVYAMEAKYRDADGNPVRSSEGWFASSDFAAGQIRGHIDSFGTFVDDLIKFISLVVRPRADDGRKYYFVGGSAGANLVVRFLQESPMASLFSKSILIVPLLGFPEFSWHKRLYMYSAYYLGFHKYYPIGQSDLTPQTIALQALDPHNSKTTDAKQLITISRVLEKHPRKTVGGATVGWVVAAEESCSKIFEPKRLAKIGKHPLLVIKASEDTMVSGPAIDRFVEAVPSAKLEVLPGRHCINLEKPEIVRRMWQLIFDFLPNPRAEKLVHCV